MELKYRNICNLEKELPPDKIIKAGPVWRRALKVELQARISQEIIKVGASTTVLVAWHHS